MALASEAGGVRARSSSLARALIDTPRASARRRNSSQNAASMLTEVRWPEIVSERLTGRSGVSAVIFAAMGVQPLLPAAVFGGYALAFGFQDVGPGKRFCPRLCAGHLLAPGTQIDDLHRHFGPNMSLGCTTRSKVVSSTKPSLIASSFRV